MSTISTVVQCYCKGQSSPSLSEPGLSEGALGANIKVENTDLKSRFVSEEGLIVGKAFHCFY